MTNANTSPYIHLSVDDTLFILADLADNAAYYKSIFDNPHLRFFQQLHKQYGIVVSMYCFFETDNFSLQDVPSTFSPEFAENAGWLKWGFHGRNQASNYQHVTQDIAVKDYRDVISELIRITNSIKCIDFVPRIHFFVGNKDNMRAMQQATYGIQGLLSPDDTRNAYYLNTTQSAQIKSCGYYYDEDMHLPFFSTDVRLEKINNIQDELPFLNDCLSNKRRETHSLLVFTHENRLDEKVTRRKIVDLCLFAQKYTIPFDFPLHRISNIIYTTE